MTKDILTFIDYRVDQLVQLNRLTLLFADELKTLYQKAQNCFLWVSLVLSYIKTTILLPAINPRELLARLPDDLKEAYTSYLPLPAPQNAGIIRRCVPLLVANYRTLTLEELEAFASIEPQGYYQTTQEQLTIFQNSLQLMFGPLIRTQDLRVNFVHPTVKDYFLQLGEDSTHAVAKMYGTSIASAHSALAEACVNYLLREEMSIDLFNEPEPSSAATAASISPVGAALDDGDNLVDIFNIQDIMFFRDEDDMNDDACSHIRNLFAPFDYTAMNWAHHYASCEHTASEILMEKVRCLSKPSNIQASNWYKYMAHQSQTVVPSVNHLDELLAVAIFDHPNALHSLLSHHDSTSDIIETRCKTGLFWAASRGHSRAVQALLEHGTHPNFLENGQSPLIAAVFEGHQDVCSVLLQTPLVDPNFGDKRTRSPLVHAVAADQHEIIRMLLAHKDILVDRADYFGFNPLLEAALSGCVQCLHCLQLDGRSNFTENDR